MSESDDNVGGNTGRFLAIGAACILIFGGCMLCGGGLAVPFVLKRRAVEMQRVEAERQRDLGEEAMRKKAAEEADNRQDAASVGGDSSESHEHN